MATSKSNDSDPFAAALRILTGRDRSEAELSEKLRQLGFSAAEIAEAVGKCLDYNYLNDQRYALERAKSLLRRGRSVGRKAILDLQRRGIDESTARQALELASEEFDNEQILCELLQRRFRDFNYQTANEKLRRRVVGYFQRRGFSLDEIFTVLKKESKD